MVRRTYTLTCQHKECAKEFLSSKPDRKYCSLTCYAATPEFKQRRDEHLKLARANYRPQTKSGAILRCVNPSCGKEFYAKQSEIKRGRQTCSRDCYHKFLALRFDRAISSPVTFEAMHGFDEYLSQTKLPCLVDGCEWEGDNLALHMNLAHGVTADEFKERVGFNKNTALLSPQLLAKFTSRGNAGFPKTLDSKKALASRKIVYRAECREHMRKRGLLRGSNRGGK